MQARPLLVRRQNAISSSMNLDVMIEVSTKAGVGPPLRGSPPRQSITLKNGFDFLPNFVTQGSALSSTRGDAPGFPERTRLESARQDH